MQAAVEQFLSADPLSRDRVINGTENRGVYSMRDIPAVLPKEAGNHAAERKE